MSHPENDPIFNEFDNEAAYLAQMEREQDEMRRYEEYMSQKSEMQFQVDALAFAIKILQSSEFKDSEWTAVEFLELTMKGIERDLDEEDVAIGAKNDDDNDDNSLPF